MVSDGGNLVAGERALAAADWKAAKVAFEAALAESECAEALSGLGYACFWLGDMTRALELRERAYLAFRERGDRAAACRLALWLAGEHAAVGSTAVVSGWVARAERLIAEMGECPERGWLLLRRARMAAEPAEAERVAREVIALAHRLHDRDLEIAAISRCGRALLAAGRIEEGFACLDEAMAGATSGEARNIDAVGDTCCDMIGACERAAEMERAMQWCRVTDEYARRYNFLPVFAFCRTTYAGVLLALGRWSEAERELHEALRTYEASFAFQSVNAVAKLAELRLLQGRDADAEALLADHAQHPSAARAIAMLHLARGDAASAARVLRKRAAAVGSDVLLVAPLLSLLVEAHLAHRDVAEAKAAAERLGAIASATRRPAFAAASSLAAGLVACAEGHPSAVDHLEAAIHEYTSVGMPLPAARARMALARCLAETDPRAAREECRAAVAAFETLGAKRDLDASADLRRRLRVGARVGRRTTSRLTRREEEVLALLGLGLSNAKIGARLYISPKTVEHHVGHILAKLDLETRAAAAAFAAKRGRKPAPK
ncbi:MAG TPA: LuxR C-terminal-related transcriptional regulator [Polyangiaceae bacterium]